MGPGLLKPFRLRPVFSLLRAQAAALVKRLAARLPLNHVPTPAPSSPPFGQDPAVPDEQYGISGDAHPCRVGQQPALSSLPVRELVSGLRAGGKDLTEACRAAEPDFLDLGERLQAIHAEAGQLIVAVNNALGADQEFSLQNVLENIRTHASGAMSDLRVNLAGVAGDLRSLHSIRDDLLALQGGNSGLRKVGRNLRMVGLNISIESARTPEARANFQSVAEEIAALSQTVNTVARDVADDSDEARRTLDAIEVEIGQRMQNLEKLMDGTQEAVDRALADVSQVLQLTLATLDATGLKAREISGQVGRLVVGIQIHDNISQRADHICQSLCDAADRLNSVPEQVLPDDPESARSIGKACAVLELQKSHLHNIASDVAGVGRQSKEALVKLAEAVGALARPESFGAGLEFHGQQAAPAGKLPVADLERSLGELLALFDQGIRDIGRLSVVREETGRIVARLGAHVAKVQEISHDIRLKALNAVIRAGRLGNSGKAIGAIVNEMKALAEQSGASIQAVRDILESIAAAADTIARQGPAAARDDGSPGVLLRGAIRDFATACSTFRNQSQAALAIGSGLDGKIGQARAGVDFFERLVEACIRHHNNLSNEIEHVKPYIGALPIDWDDADEAGERYTMQRERKTHQELQAGFRALSPKALQQPDNEPDDAQARDDAHPWEGGSAGESSDAEWDNVELF